MPEPIARNHRKIVVVDGARAITGGFGIWKSWVGDGRKRDEWRDTAVRVAGPVVAQMQKAFEQSWRESGGDPLGDDAYPKLASKGPTRALFVASSPRPDQASAAERSTSALIASARKRLWIANSYFIPNEELTALIVETKRRGVDVRVLVPGPVHDVPPVRAAQRATYEPLLQAGVRIFEYQASMMHAKTMVIDDRFVVIGSTNLDALSFDRLEEGSLVADAAVLARKLQRHIDEDMRTYSKEITAREWAGRELLPEMGRRAATLIDDWL
jgi:cardiolipin synthase